MTAPEPVRLRLGPRARIKRRGDFFQIRRDGRRLAGGCLALNWRALPAQSQSRLGVITSGKIGNAVERSRARRLLRQAFRIHQHELSRAADLVLVARPSIVGRAFCDVQQDFLAALRRAGLLKARA